MANDLSFFDYKQAVVDATSSSNPSYLLNPRQQPIFHDKNESIFYRLSFYHRTSAELEYQLLNMLVNVEGLPEHYKRQANQYLEYGAHFLLRDAEIAGNTAEAKKYQDKIAAFAASRAVQPNELPVTVSEWQKSVDRFYKDLNDYLSTPFHVSKFITLLSYINLYRLLTVFSRLSFKSFWTLASERQWIDGQDKLFGYPLQRSALDMPRDALNILSVALFLMRLASHFSMILKHGRSQRPGEKDIDAWDRMAREFSTRMVDIMNDGAWWWVNLLTNFAPVFQISDPVSNTLLALTLVYDCTWLAIHWYRKERDWGLKEKELIAWKAQSGDSYDKTITDYQLRLVKDVQWEIRCKYAFSIVACLSIITSYLLFLAAISSAVSAICLLVCVTGFAMYGSADEFGGWMRAEFGAMKIKNEREEMRAKFFKNFTQAFCSPILVMGLMAFSWKVALLAAVGAFLYQYLPASSGNRPVREVQAVPPMAEVVGGGRPAFGV